MSERPPDFNESDPGWVRLDVLRGLLGIKHAQMQRIRKQLGNAYEKSGKKPAQPVWVYAPLWLPAKFKLDTPTIVHNQADDATALQRIKRETAEFDLAVKRAEYVHRDIAIAILDETANTIHHTLDDAEPDFASLVSERLSLLQKELPTKLAEAAKNGNSNKPPS